MAGNAEMKRNLFNVKLQDLIIICLTKLECNIGLDVEMQQMVVDLSSDIDRLQFRMKKGERYHSLDYFC